MLQGLNVEGVDKKAKRNKSTRPWWSVSLQGHNNSVHKEITNIIRKSGNLPKDILSACQTRLAFSYLSDLWASPVFNDWIIHKRTWRKQNVFRHTEKATGSWGRVSHSNYSCRLKGQPHRPIRFLYFEICFILKFLYHENLRAVDVPANIRTWRFSNRIWKRFRLSQLAGCAFSHA